MTVNRSSTIKDMVAGEIEPNTRLWQRVADHSEVLQAVAAWDAWSLWDDYNQDKDQWVIDNPPPAVPPEEIELKNKPFFAEVADPENITVPETIFLEARFFATHDNGETPKAVNVGWVQLKPNVELSPGFWGDLLAMYNALRSMTPYAP